MPDLSNPKFSFINNTGTNSVHVNVELALPMNSDWVNSAMAIDTSSTILGILEGEKEIRYKNTIADEFWKQANTGTLQYSTVQYSTVQYSTVQYSTVQYSTVQYSTVQ